MEVFTKMREARRLAVGGLMVAIGAWLWPIGFGGRMPVGGDVTQFSIGPMAVLSRAIRSGRIPYWNELWGYGFPGVGESQMGVFYPPHWLIYGLMTPEAGYTASLVLHTLFGGLGAYYAARRFGASEAGSALGGFAWSTCGFYLIHLSHQWGYTTGCWMPWAWGLAWSIASKKGGAREGFLLAGVLAVQLLPGHFQLAFCTQVGVLVLLGVNGFEGWLKGEWGGRRVLIILAGMLGAFVLAGVQVWPTYRLARLAGARRDFEYLSGFAATPLHLATFVAPGLFERSPLWRPIVWDPFHTSPEEYLGYVGLVPLFLAMGALAKGWRGSAAVRALAVVAGVTLVLSLGPYVPGFRVWCALPGFSFFRAPSRWLLATSLAVSCLAALGFDSLPSWRRPGRGVVWFVVGGLAIPLVVLALGELGLWSAGRQGWPGLRDVYVKGFNLLPWHERGVFEKALGAATRANLDFRVGESWAREGVVLSEAPRPVFVERRFGIYRQELMGSTLILVVLLASAHWAGTRWFRGVLVVLTLLDLLWLGQQRRVDMGPIARLTEQSPVLRRMRAEGVGTRTLDGLRNMGMVAGVGPVSAYRTLDLPALETLTALAGSMPGRQEDVDVIMKAMRLTGAQIRVFEPMEGVELKRRGISWPGGLEEIIDPALAGWKYGKDWVRQQGGWARTFWVGRVEGEAARGWLLPATWGNETRILGEWSGRARDVLGAMEGARGVEVRVVDPETREAVFETNGAALLVLSELADPEWEAELGGVAAGVERAFGRVNQGAWQAVRIPGAGEWKVKMSYRGRDVRQGMWISAGALVVMAGLMVWTRRETR